MSTTQALSGTMRCSRAWQPLQPHRRRYSWQPRLRSQAVTLLARSSQQRRQGSRGASQEGEVVARRVGSCGTAEWLYRCCAR